MSASGLKSGEDALKLSIYFGERSRIRGRLLADELLDTYARHEIRGSILLRGAQGFGAKHHHRSDRLLTLSEDLPLVAIAVDSSERIQRLLGETDALGHEGLVTLERVHLSGMMVQARNTTSPTTTSPASTRATPAAGLDLPAPGRTACGSGSSPERVSAPSRYSSASDETAKLTVYLGRHERVNGRPAFVAVCEILHESGMTGATVLLGVDGTDHGKRARARFFARNANVPLMVTSVGYRRGIMATLGDLRRVLVKPTFTIERVCICKRDGVLLQAPHDSSVSGDRGMDVRQKLTVVVSEATVHKKRPVYLELVRRLRAAQAAGATSLRGIWGFHGDHAPHGDRLLSIRRHVPIVTVVIDTPERIAELFPIADELTHETGLVTSELIPVSSPPHGVPGL